MTDQQLAVGCEWWFWLLQFSGIVVVGWIGHKARTLSNKLSRGGVHGLHLQDTSVSATRSDGEV